MSKKKNLLSIKRLDALYSILSALRLTHENHMSGNIDDAKASLDILGLLDAADLIIVDFE